MKAYRIIAQPKVIRQDRLVVADESRQCDNPVFLTGIHRSGTTLMRQMVDSHPGIACPPETFFLKELNEFRQENLTSTGLESMGFDEEAVVRGLARSARFFFETYAASKDKPRWADKTPTYVFCLDFIEQLFGPGCQYVMIYRHPFDVVQSLDRKGWKLKGFMDYDPDPFMNVVKYVADGVTKQRDFQKAHAERCFESRYEILTDQTEPTLRAMFEFLGEPWDERVLTFNDQQHDWGTGDPEALVFKGIRRSVNNWHSWTDERVDKAYEVLKPMMEDLGYTAEREADESAPPAQAPSEQPTR